MNEPLERFVEQTINHVMYSFRVDDHRSFEECDAQLQEAEAHLLSAESGSALEGLVSRIRATRISLAAETGKVEAVLQQSAEFVRICRPGSLDFFNVAVFRLQALHASQLHDEELQEAASLAMRPEIQGEFFVLLLEAVIRRHPGVIKTRESLLKKLRYAIEELKQSGYENLKIEPPGEAGLEQITVKVAAELRRVNQARAMALLADGGT